MTGDDDTLITPGPASRIYVADAIARLPLYLSDTELKLANGGRSVRLTQDQALEVADRALMTLLDAQPLNANTWLNKVNRGWRASADRAEAALRQEKTRRIRLVNFWRTLAGLTAGGGARQTFQDTYHFSYSSSLLLVLPLVLSVLYFCIADIVKGRRTE